MTLKAGWEAGDEVGYVQHLEGLFLELRGRGVQWSPEDSARASHWYKAGLPLASVVGAIEGRVRTFRYLNGNDASLPRHLGWYEPTVIKARGRMRLPPPATAALLPGPDAVHVHDGAAATLLDLMDALPDLVDGAADPALAEAYRRALRGLRRLGDQAMTSAATGEIDAPPSLDAATFEAGLKRCRATLVRTLLAGIGPAAAGEIQAGVDAKLVAERADRGSKKARQARTRILLERALGERWGLQLPTSDGWRPGKPVGVDA
jgi:hypothetical protein